MKVKSYVLGEVAVFVNADELLPQDTIDMATSLAAMTQRYGFVSSPKPSDPVEKIRERGLRFEKGRFGQKGDERNIQDFALWSDGLLVTAFKTDDAEAFLEDCLTWGQKHLGLRRTLGDLPLRKYNSQVVVEFDERLTRMLTSFEPICDAYNEMLRRTYNGEFPKTQVESIAINYDHAVAPTAFNTLTPFIIEQRENHRHTDSVFFSSAPLRTPDHIQLLETFERLLSS